MNIPSILKHASTGLPQIFRERPSIGLIQDLLVLRGVNLYPGLFHTHPELKQTELIPCALQVALTTQTLILVPGGTGIL